MNKIKKLILETAYILTPAQKKLCILVFSLTCIGSLLECLGVSIIIPLINVLQNPDSIMKSSIVTSSGFLAGLDYNQIVCIIIVGIVILYVVKNLYFIFQSWLRIKFSCKILRETSVKMMISFMSRGYQFFLNFNYGEYMRGVLSDSSAIYTVLNGTFKIISDAFTIMLICVFMFITDWKMAISVLALASMCIALIFFVFRKKMLIAGKASRKYSALSNQTLAQSYEGVKDVLLLGKQRYFIYEYEKNCVESQKAQCTSTVAAESPSYIIEGICVSGLMLTVCVRVVLGGNDSGFIAVLAAFAVGAFRVLPCLGRISSSINALTVSIPQISALYENVRQAEAYATEHPEATNFIKSNANSRKIINRESTRFESVASRYEGVKFKEKLEVNNVSFSYKEELGEILSGINLNINKGEAVAIIGESGSGKSTLVDVILGLLKPKTGHISMDGIAIEDIYDMWTETIGYVPQTVFLTDDSILKNVAFGVPESEINVDLVNESLQKANLLDFINELPEGINTCTGDRGVRLSGGQRQRIAIARALYRKPEILVLDEATSALDNDTESAIMDAINSLYGQVTLIIVAHRLTTLKNCDVIYEVRNSGIIQREKMEVLGK